MGVRPSRALAILVLVGLVEASEVDLHPVMLLVLGDGLDLATGVDVLQVLGEVNLVLRLLFDGAVGVLGEFELLRTVQSTNLIIFC